MKDYFGMTQEQFRAWLLKHVEHEPDCGVFACSPEIYAEMMKEIPDVGSTEQLPEHPSDKSPSGGTEGA